ncbi:MAG: hypothetical protein K6U03_12460, partial [Firmicutes bacterium]|nr:hypothetical protein [Bacillota bacterium]
PTPRPSLPVLPGANLLTWPGNDAPPAVALAGLPAILAVYEKGGPKKWFDLARYLRTSYELELWEANVVVYYYQHPEKREELGEGLAIEVV